MRAADAQRYAGQYMSVVYISPQHVSTDLVGASIEKKLEIFEAQVKGWLLDHAHALSLNSYPPSKHAGISILALCLVYVEAIACFINGQTSDGKSKAFFKDGLIAIFPEYSSALHKYSDDFYREVRCGLIHQGMTRGKIGICQDSINPIEIHDSTGIFEFAMINPWLFLDRVHQHFDRYLADARNPANTTLRHNFEVWFDNRPA
ncbi:MAG: hypothetical protein ACREA9_08055 [Pyrinomonadaceae bacterium]